MLKGKKEESFAPFFIAMLISMGIAFFWNSSDFIKGSAHAILDPSLGTLLNWNLTIGMLMIIVAISFLTNIVQKYTTDQERIKELKKEQKELNAKMKEFRRDPEKVMKLQKELAPLTISMFKLSSRPIMFTAVPFVLLFRWFMDFFVLAGNPKFFGIFTWFWFYLIFTIIISSVFRKILKVH